MHYYRFITLTIATTFLLALSTTVSASTDPFPGSSTDGVIDKKEHRDNGNHYGAKNGNGDQSRQERANDNANGTPGSSTDGVIDKKEHRDNGNHSGAKNKPLGDGSQPRHEQAGANSQPEASLSATSATSDINSDHVSDQAREERKEKENISKDQVSDKYENFGTTVKD